MECFSQLDHESILSCLSDDVEWIVPGLFHRVGKEEFDKEIENEAFTGYPKIELGRMVEEGNMVVAEGKVECTRNNGDLLTVLFCDVFEIEHEKIKRLTSYLMETK